MDKKLRAKIERGITSRWNAADRVDWAKALCKLILWYGERHPDAQVDREGATKFLKAWGTIKVSIDRDGQGFKAECYRPYSGTHHYHITTRGLLQ